jgi:hypothetical protein
MEDIEGIDPLCLVARLNHHSGVVQKQVGGFRVAISGKRDDLIHR